MAEEKRKMLTLAQRLEISDALFQEKAFHGYYLAIKYATGKTDDEINEMDNGEIVSMALEIIDENNFSKKKKSNTS